MRCENTSSQANARTALSVLSLPPPLWGRAGVGGSNGRNRCEAAPPTSRGKVDFCEEQKSSRVVLPHKGGGGERTERTERVVIALVQQRLKLGATP
jgi:hypothetical protein